MTDHKCNECGTEEIGIADIGTNERTIERNNYSIRGGEKNPYSRVSKPVLATQKDRSPEKSKDTYKKWNSFNPCNQ
jgi:hypothetical protein